jgi:hypothetical protein
MNSAYIYDGVTLTIFHKGETHTINSDFHNFDECMKHLNEGDFDAAVLASSLTQKINQYGNGLVKVVDGVVYYDGKPIHNSLTSRILMMIKQGVTVTPLVNFMNNLMKNPSGRAVQELYRFMECNKLPITPDGFLLAYKNVDDRYMDKHSGTFRNMIGDVCEMHRNQVMDDPNQTCAPGLHFCSLEYLKGFWGTSGHTMVVKINPADVVSIPVDYNNSKGRCCRYQVVAEHTYGTDRDFFDEDVVVYF